MQLLDQKREIDLTIGEGASVGDARIELTRESTGVLQSAIDDLVSELATTQSADQALERILTGVMAASSAATGAVILNEEGTYRVACARDENGEVLRSAAELLSDTIVRDVLGTGERLCLSNVGTHARYANVPSVTSMRLRSVLCVPIGAGGAPLGAVFLGNRDAREPFSERVASDLRMLASMALPFLATLRANELGADVGRDKLVGESASMEKVATLIKRVGPSDLSVMIAGESGTGKELVARAIHDASPRRNLPLIAINCAAVPESLLSAELFGYKKGAFSGAVTDRAGLVEAAEGSTLFLDEVGDMPMPMQAALLRVLEAREVTRLGENEPRPVDFRLVCASHRDLDDEVATGRMREDLVFRLRELTLELPPLRERGNDVLLLARFFLRQTELGLSLPMHSLGEDAEQALLAHPFRGNVRELKATMRRAAILSDSRSLSAADLGLQAKGGAPSSALGDLSRPLAEARDDFVRRYAAAVLEQCGGDRELAARELGVGVRSLYRYIN